MKKRIGMMCLFLMSVAGYAYDAPSGTIETSVEDDATQMDIQSSGNLLWEKTVYGSSASKSEPICKEIATSSVRRQIDSLRATCNGRFSNSIPYVFTRKDSAGYFHCDTKSTGYCSKN